MKAKGKQIHTIEAIIKLAQQQKSVWVERWRKPVAAAFLIGWQVRLLQQWVEGKQFFTTVDDGKISLLPKGIPFKKKAK